MSLRNRIERLERARADLGPTDRSVFVADPGDFPDAAAGDIKFWPPCEAWYLIVPSDLGPDPDPIGALSPDQRGFLEPDDVVIVAGCFDTPGGGGVPITTNSLRRRTWAEVCARRGEAWRCG